MINNVVRKEHVFVTPFFLTQSVCTGFFFFFFSTIIIAIRIKKKSE